MRQHLHNHLLMTVLSQCAQISLLKIGIKETAEINIETVQHRNGKGMQGGSTGGGERGALGTSF